MSTDDKTPISGWKTIPPTPPLMRPSDVLKETGLSRSTLYDLIASGDFPPFIKIGRRASAMPRVWLEAYIQGQAEHLISKYDRSAQ